MGPYAVVEYNLTLCPLQSRLQHIYHGQPARVDFIPQSGTLDLASVRKVPEVCWSLALYFLGGRYFTESSINKYIEAAEDLLVILCNPLLKVCQVPIVHIFRLFLVQILYPLHSLGVLGMAHFPILRKLVETSGTSQKIPKNWLYGNSRPSGKNTTESKHQAPSAWGKKSRHVFAFFMVWYLNV